MITRRKLLLGLGAVAVPSLVRAQRRVYRVAILHSESRESAASRVAAFVQALNDLGYEENRNLELVQAYANANPDVLNSLASEVVRRGIDVIFAPNAESVRAAQRFTSLLPIVFANVGDPVAFGFAMTLAKPGKNMTGLSNIARDLAAKRLQILHEVFPRTTRVAALVSTLTTSELKILEPAAKELNVRLFPVVIRNRAELREELDSARSFHPDAVYIQSSPSTSANRTLLVDYARFLRLPSIAGLREFADVGALMTYGPDFRLLYRRAATYVDKILRGSKPGDLPIELPVNLEFVLNRRAAKQLGISFAQSVLLRADRFID